MLHARSLLSLAALALLSGMDTYLAPCIAQDSETLNKTERLQKQVESEVQQLEKLVGDHPCRQAVLIAIRDPKVRSLVLRKLSNECYVLKDICCLQRPMIPEQEQVLFNFDCAPNCFCLLDPQFLVTVDKVNKKVMNIVDPYMGPTKPCVSIRDEAPSPEDDGGCEGCSSDRRCKVRGKAAYAAVQSGDSVYVFASGVHPTPGFKKCLELGPEDIFPPFVDFRITPPDGTVPQVITPFTVCLRFQAGRPIRAITVRDVDGGHTVPVKQL